MSLSFQDIILTLQSYWSRYGCVILQPYDMEMGAGTTHPATMLKALGEAPWNCAYVQPCRRPNDGRYGENPRRTQYYYQFQVILKPAPADSQDLYLKSLEALGLSLINHDIRFVEDDWENPTLGAAGLGWEVWCDGAEVTQFTYFQQVGGIACHPPCTEITYGLERIATVIQGVESHFALDWNGAKGDKNLSYADVLLDQEKQFSAYNFEHANTNMLSQHFKDYTKECEDLLAQNMIYPAYEQCIKASHTFNVLQARGVISVTERANYIARVRTLAKACCDAYNAHAA